MEIWEHNVKALRDDACSWCGGIIKAGEKYKYIDIKEMDGTNRVWKSHFRCEKLTYELDMWSNDSFDGTLNSDEFYQSIQDWLYERNWFEGEFANDDFGDWTEDTSIEDKINKVYEILNKEKGLEKSFVEKDRSTINIKDDKSLDDVTRFIWADNDTDKI